MNSNAIYGLTLHDEESYSKDCNFFGFLVIEGSRLEAIEGDVILPEDKQTDQEFIIDLLSSKRSELINKGYDCGLIETKKMSEWAKLI
jgi:hypothetical protein